MAAQSRSTNARMNAVDIDPRIARSKAAILDAAVGLLLGGGVHDTTVDAIADRARVSKATIYRHWSSRQELVIDALAELKPDIKVPDTGSLRGDLKAITNDLRSHLASPAAAAFSSLAGAAEHDAQLASLRQEFIAARRHPIQVVVEAAIERGELPADLDTDLFVAMVAGPLFYRRVVQGRRVPAHWAEAVVEVALVAAATPL